MMIKVPVLVIAASLALPAFAQGSSAGSSSTGSRAENPNRKICERIEKIGSRLATAKVCMTAAEWKAHRQVQREDFERVQRVVNQAPSN